MPITPDARNYGSARGGPVGPLLRLGRELVELRRASVVLEQREDLGRSGEAVRASAG